MLDRRLCEATIEHNEPLAKLFRFKHHSAADVNVKHILVAEVFLQGIVWLAGRQAGRFQIWQTYTT